MKSLKRIIKIAVFCLFTALFLCSCSANEITANTNQDSDNYVENEDYRNYIKPFSGITKADGGYYFLSGTFLYYYDVENREAYPFCSKVNCEHNNSECEAYLSPTQFNFGMDIYNYNNALYVLGHEQGNNSAESCYIYQISLENAKQRKAAYLFDSTPDMSVVCILHRGYVYFSNDGGGENEAEATLCRAKLGEIKKGKVEVIYRFKGYGASIGDLNAYGNNVFFNTYSYSDNKGNGYKSEINYINIHTLKTQSIHSGGYSSFPTDNKIYYFFDDKTVNCYDIKTNEDKVFLNIGEPCRISADSKYIYFDNEKSISIGKTDKKNRKISIFDKSGKHITDIVPKNPKDDCYFGGDDVMIFKEQTAGEETTDNSENGAKGYYVLDKSQLKSDNKQFIDME